MRACCRRSELQNLGQMDNRDRILTVRKQPCCNSRVGLWHKIVVIQMYNPRGIPTPEDGHNRMTLRILVGLVGLVGLFALAIASVVRTCAGCRGIGRLLRMPVLVAASSAL